MTNQTETQSYPTGVVSFLDILGWKGIWLNRNDAIPSLNEFIQKFRDYGNSISTEIKRSDFKIICFSDTIVIFTPSDGKNFKRSIDFHVKLCQWALENSLSPKYNLPLRGAIGYGEYYYHSDGENTSILGPVIDEVSSWGAKADWIGVILAPSIQFEIRHHNINVNELKEIGTPTEKNPHPIPFKENIRGLDLFVKWGDLDGVKLLVNLIKNQRYTPSDATLKYLNTLAYLESKDKVIANSNSVEIYTLKTGATLEFGNHYNDVVSLFVEEVSIDSNYVRITFYLKKSGKIYPETRVLPVGASREFEAFKILVKYVFLGTQNSLVEFEVTYYN